MERGSAPRGPLTPALLPSRVDNSVDVGYGPVIQAGVIHGGVHLHAPASARPAPRQLPREAGPLVGRARELDRMDTALQAGGIALITGMAGIGKTALAVHWARGVQDDFPDGQLHVDLQGFGPGEPLSAQDVLAAFLRALGQERPDELATTAERVAAFRTLTTGRRLLLVLDNACRVEQVRPLLPGGEGCTAIVTSRASLTGLGVHHQVLSLPLERLDETDALAVLGASLGARAGAAPGTVRALARYCGGLPLALRIAAARAAERGAESGAGLDGLSGTDTPLDLLDAGDDESSALRTVFSWSYRALPGPAAQAFRGLGAHPGPGIDVFALAAATGTTPEGAGAALRTLVKGHLLAEPAPGRFEAHDLLRAYASELGSAERDMYLARLYDYYLDVADRADDLLAPLRFRVPRDRASAPGPDLPDPPAALAWLDTTLPTLVALCTSDDERYDDRRWRLAHAVRGYFYFTKRLDSWITTHEAALRAALRLADPLAEALTRTNLGMALVAAGRLAGAEENYARAHDLFVRLGDVRGRAGASANLASVLRRRGALTEALDKQREALAYYRRDASDRHVCITLRTMASVETDLGRFADAVAHAEEAIAIASRLQLHLEAAQGFNSLGITLLRMGDATRAGCAHGRAVSHSRAAGSAHQEARSLYRLGAAALASGDRERAARWWALAARLFRRIGAAEAEQVASDLASLTGRGPSEGTPGS
ncbi:tetratricopeptide repeat protein [Streptomyces sp. CFMR 7]|uniref:tetratricopeptide repeat protein n=1 Tax=Streptomyces sp. CFMR 7 TaxID=1649184 RepID=UPI0011A02EF6|nr:tetratricopeptide repeat protein [Streptomyces sp. CFMR 7]